MSSTLATKTEKAEAITKLRELLPLGSTVYTVLRHVSRSGMQRSISCILCGEGEPYQLDYLLVRAGLGRFDRKHSGIIVGGCGMDMGFHLVYNLAYTLYPTGFECAGPWCPSNDHSNGDRNYSPDHTHKEGGYALRQRWI